LSWTDRSPPSTIEQNRLNKQHSALRSLLGNRIIRAPLHEPSLILDIGCGTGPVTRELGRLYSSAASIYGIDLSPVPASSFDSSTPNVSFIAGDARKLMGSDPRMLFGTADFVFNRLLLCGMTDWPGYVRDVYRMVKPGGWVEMQDFEEMFYLRGVMLEDEAGWRWLKEFRRGAKAKGMDLDCGRNIKKYMVDAGFVDVDAKQFQVPFWEDGDRPETKKMSQLEIDDPDGFWWHAIPRMVEGLGFKDEDVKDMQNAMKRCVAEEEGKYMVFWTTVGRKPV
jgi:ubiquinone/menaquinone biosynthesis C-methylase UbiE